VVIERGGNNELTISGLCDAPISADVESATTFSFGPVRNCLTSGTVSCNSSQLSLDGGEGQLTLKGLAIDMQGGVTSCGALVGGVHAVFLSSQETVSNLRVTIQSQPSNFAAAPAGVRVGAQAIAFTPAGGPVGDPEYAWTLGRPKGSAAVLENPTGATTAFTPDVVGTYILGVDVTDGGSSGGAVVQWSVANAAPVAIVPSTQPPPVVTGSDVTLDASLSTDANDDPLTFHWQLVEAPPGSTAAIVGATSAMAHLVPDVPGFYTAWVEVSDGIASSIEAVRLWALAPVPFLPFEAAGVAYSRAVDRIIAVSASPDLLHLVDPFTLNETSLALPAAPTDVSLSNDGLLALVGTQQGSPSVIDLGSLQITKTWTASMAVTGIGLLSDEVSLPDRVTRYAYRFSASSVAVLDMGSDAVVLQNLPDPVSAAVLDPHGGGLFTIEGFGGALVHYTMAASGALSVAGARTDPSDNLLLRGGLWISRDGQTLASRKGLVARTSDLASLNVSLPFVPNWIEWSSNGDAVLLSEAHISTWNPATPDVAAVDVADLPPYLQDGVISGLSGRYLFSDASGTHRIVLAQPLNGDPHLAVLVY
jgi:hypothetical protein